MRWSVRDRCISMARSSRRASMTATCCAREIRFAGPAIVSEYSSATILPPGDVLRVDELGNLVIEVSDGDETNGDGQRNARSD